MHDILDAAMFTFEGAFWVLAKYVGYADVWECWPRHDGYRYTIEHATFMLHHKPLSLSACLFLGRVSLMRKGLRHVS